MSEKVRHLRFIAAALVIQLASGSLSTPVEARTWVVNPLATGDFPTIQAAVTAATAGDEVVLTDGTYRGEGNRNIDFGGKAITVRSQSDDPTACVIDCEATATWPERRGFFFQSGEGRDSVVQGLTIRNGGADLGGGIACYVSSPSIINVGVVDCLSDEGGGLFGQWSSPLIEGCLIARNYATSFPGGGIFFTLECNPVIRNTTIAMNRSGVDPGGDREGGGLALHRFSFAVIEHSIIAGNLRGEAVHCDVDSGADISCSNVFGNEGGDWIGCISDQTEMNGNLSADPLFCDPLAGSFGLASVSPCAPSASACGLIGALDVACTVVHMQSLSWGRIKGLYRE